MKRKIRYFIMSLDFKSKAKHLTFILGLITLCTIGMDASAQSRTVSGTIYDDIGSTLPGASVVEKGTTNGVSSDIDGKYSITLTTNDPILVISFMGFISQEIKVADQTVITIKMASDAQALEDLVVVGFGRQKRESVVGSITSIKPGDLKQPTSSITPMLMGRVSGVTGVQRSGAPGEDESNFFIRGVSSFGNSMSSPLILIDGFEADMTELNDMDPENIESFSILKDASATALYGASGANGVILVNTKKGEKGKLTFSVNIEQKVSSPTSMPENVDAETYMRLYNEAQTNRDPYAIPRFSEDYIANTLAGTDPYLYPNMDWLGSLTKPMTNNTKANINIRGGSDKTQYYVSASWFQDNGAFKDDPTSLFGSNIEINRFNFLSNITMDLTETTEFGLIFSGVFESYQGPIGDANTLYKQARYTSPVAFVDRFPHSDIYPSIPYGNTQAAAGGGGLMVNPYAELTKGYRDRYLNDIKTTVNLKQDLNKYIKGLSARAMLTFKNNNNTNAQRQIDPYYYYKDAQKGITQVNEGTAFLNYSNGDRTGTRKYYIETSALWSRNFNDEHDVSAMALWKIEEQVNLYPSDLEASLPFRKQGFAGRVTYGFRDKYLIEGNFGYSGSENFAEGQRYAWFPSVAGGYYISKEDFMDWSKPVLSKLKFRFSYGLVGNDRLVDSNGSAIRFPYIDYVTPGGSNFTFGEDFTNTISGPTINRYANPNITWEVATKSNIGFELGLFDKFNMELDLYRNIREDILMKRSNLPAGIGVGTANPWANLGIVKNQGIDITWDYSHNITDEMWISARGTFTYYQNEVIENDEPNYAYDHLRQEGKALGLYQGFVAERLFIDDADIANSATQFGTVLPGDIKYKDIVEDGVIDDNDKIYMGDPADPTLLYGFGVSSGYKNWDLSFFFQGIGNTSLMMSGFWPFDMGSTSGNEERNVMTFITEDRWTQQNPDPYAKFPRLSDQTSNNNTVNSTYWLRDASYLRLQNAEIGYKIPDNIIKKAQIKSLRLYVSGINLLTFSPFKEWDPAMGGGDGNAMGYPLQRVVAFGAQMKF